MSILGYHFDLDGDKKKQMEDDHVMEDASSNTTAPEVPPKKKFSTDQHSSQAARRLDIDHEDGEDEALTTMKEAGAELITKNASSDGGRAENEEIIGLLERQKSEAETNTRDLQDALQEAERKLIRSQRECKEKDMLLSRAGARSRDLEKKAVDNNEALHRIRAELTDCKDELFSFQLPAQPTDTSIIDAWDKLCSDIELWVDTNLGKDPNLVAQLKKFLKDHDEMSDIVLHWWNRESQELANRHPGILNDLLYYNIHCLLEETIFNPSILLLGLHHQGEDLLRLIEDQLSKLDPPRGPSRINAWRSETLTALYSSPKLLENQRVEADEITRTARDFLRPVLPGLTKDTMTEFYRHITKPAIDLACNMRRCTNPYYFSMPVEIHRRDWRRSQLHSPGKGNRIHSTNLSSCVAVDVVSRRTLKPNMNIQMDQNGYICQEILLYYPALYCRKKEEVLCLRSPKLLVEMFEPIPRLVKQKTSEYASRSLQGT